MFKNIFSIICALVCVASADGAVKVGRICYDLDESTKTASVAHRSGGTYSGNIVIPESVTYEKTAYSVTSIGWFAFQHCERLKKVTIPSSVTSIGSSVFEGCRSLKYNVYDNARYLGNDENPYHVLVASASKNISSCNINENCKIIYDGAFINCDSLTSVTIPDGVTSINWHAFSGCRSLTSVTIPDGVTFINWYAFSGCCSLTSVTIPNSVTSIGWGAFENCDGLTSVTIPNGVKSIGIRAFQNCLSLTSVTIPNSVAVIGHGAFYGCDSLKYNVYGNAKYLGNDENPYHALVAPVSENITSCNINENCRIIGEYAFRGCHGLTSVTIPNSVAVIGHDAFYGCDSLKYNVYDNAKYLGNNENPYHVLVAPVSENITSCNINENCRMFCNPAFFGCRGLTSVKVCAMTPPELKRYSFYDNQVTKIIVPKGAKEAYEKAEWWNKFEIVEE
ncbi:MAG: leucine-rich repeat domain-containing protein [Bacteroidales bacterium]|nr:leucine-rich repeat domain-containing protein [Bacteroidales bacterium]